VDCMQNDISPVNFRHIGGRDSSVGIATRYELDGPGSNPGGGGGGGVRFSAPVQTGRVAHLVSCTIDRGSFPQR